MNPEVCQILEVGAVKVEGTTIQLDDALHFYIEWPQVTYETEALDLFGDRRKDRKPHVPVVTEAEACNRIYKYIFRTKEEGKWTLGGKNFAKFDLKFLNKMVNGFENMIDHRCIDLGNKYDDPLDDRLPGLETCRTRAIKCGVSGQVIGNTVTHTALEDALLCAELYVGWQRGLVSWDKWRPTRPYGD